MKIIPVLDILRGVVVRGIAGRRDEYRPLTSQLTSSTHPLDVARAIRDAFGLSEFYLADLDAIITQRPNHLLYETLIQRGFQLLIDPGIRRAVEVDELTDAGLTRIVVGLESCQSPTELKRIAAKPIEVVFSLDLLSGQPRRSRDSTGWSAQVTEILDQVIQANVASILVLDLADVGMSTGGSTTGLCQRIHEKYPHAKIITGGGIRHRDDLMRWNKLPVDAVLIASALHNGRFRREDLVDWIQERDI